MLIENTIKPINRPKCFWGYFPPSLSVPPPHSGQTPLFVSLWLINCLLFPGKFSTQLRAAWASGLTGRPLTTSGAPPAPGTPSTTTTGSQSSLRAARSLTTPRSPPSPPSPCHHWTGSPIPPPTWALWTMWRFHSQPVTRVSPCPVEAK